MEENKIIEFREIVKQFGSQKMCIRDRLKPVMDTYEATKEELTAALAKLVEQEEDLEDAKEQMAAGKKQLEDMQTQVNNGARCV